MTPSLLLALIVDPTLAWLSTCGLLSDDRARIMLLAIAGQECGLTSRCQVIAGGKRGPARGLWQFEKGGGVSGVLTHLATKKLAAQACAVFLVEPTSAAVHDAIEQNDQLACVFARLLLFSDPATLPSDEAGGWSLYKRCWRPGRPHPETWPVRWRMATEALPLRQVG